MTSSVPEISVVLPTHNVAPWLRECLSSLLDDQDVDLEVIAVDDRSTDDTPAILAEIAAGDPRLRVVANPGRGGADARNAGVDLARAPHLAFCDSDDLVPRGAYRVMLDSARENGADMVVGSFLKFFTNRTWRPTASWEAFDEDRLGTTLLEQPSLIRNRACWNRVFRTDFWRASAIEFPTVARSNDVVPMTTALCRAVSINVVTDTVYLYRARPGLGSMSAQAHGVAGLLSYLEQERRSLELTGALEDHALRAVHEDLYLNADGWVHLHNFLLGAGFAECRPSDLDDLRAALTAVDALLTPGSVDRLTPERRWIFGLTLAGQWADAAQVIQGSRCELDWSARVDLLLRLAESPLGADPEMMVHLAESLLVAPLARRQEPEVGAAASLRRARALLAEIFPMPVRADHPAAYQHLLQVLHRDDEEELERLLGQLPLRFALRRSTIEPGGPVLRILHTGPAGDSVRFDLRRGRRSRRLKGVHLGWSEPPMMVAFPRRIGAGEWSLRVTATIDGHLIDAPVSLAPVAPERMRIHGRDILLPKPTPARNGAVLDLGPGRWGRALRP